MEDDEDEIMTMSAMEEIVEYSVVEVKSFLKRLLLEIHWKSEGGICRMYKDFIEIHNLPPVEDVAESLGSDHIFRYLYSEIRFRRLSRPTFQDRIDCWENYNRLFKRLLGGVEIWLPNHWLWDLVDQFVNQFQSFCQFRPKQTLTEEEEDMELHQLNEEEEPWSAFASLDLLRYIVQESSVGQIFNDDTEVVYPEDVSKALGYFAMVGLLRVHCLLGQYQTGLNRSYPIDISKRGYYTQVFGCQISTVHHCAFANLMVGKFDVAVRGLNRFLLYLYRSKSYLKFLLAPKQIKGKISQMYALLAVCHLVCSQDDLIDANVVLELSKRFGADIKKAYTQRKSFRRLLHCAWPNFTAPFAPHVANLRDAYRKKPMCLQDDNEPYISHNQLQLDSLIDTLIALVSQLEVK